MKKKADRVKDLLTEFIVSNTINIWEVLSIFKPYIVCQRKGGHNPTREIPVDAYDNESKVEMLLGVFSFKISKNDIKKYNLRNFKIKEGLWYYIWLRKEYIEETNEDKYEIIITNGEVYQWYGKKLTLYHFLMNMNRLVPGCLYKIEMMLMEKI